MNRKEKRIIKRMVKGHFDTLYKSAAKVAKSFDRESIPLTTLRELIDRAEFKTETPAFASFAKNFNQVLETLYDTCVAKAAEFEDTRVPLTVLKAYCAQCVSGFYQGLDEQNQ